MDFKANADLGATLIRWDSHTFLIDTLLDPAKPHSATQQPHSYLHAHTPRPASASNLHHSTTTINDLANPADHADLLNPLQSDLNHVTTLLLSNFMSAARLILSLARNNLYLPPFTRVLATRPTLDLMRHCLEESIHSRLSDTSVASANTGAANVQAVYQLLDSVSERATVVTFGETLLLSPGFELACASSAFTIGSANFAITHGSQKLVILSETSACTSRFPEPMDIDPLGFADILFVSALSTSPARNWDDSLRDLDKLILHHAHLRRPLIFPLSVTSPVFFDVLHALCRTLDVHPALLESTLVVILSPVMDTVTEYVNVSSEHLHPFQRARTHEGRLPMLPSALSDPKYAARFRTYSGLGDPEVEAVILDAQRGAGRDMEPKAVFVIAGHEGFMRGDAVEAARMIGRGGEVPVTVCITDPRAADKWMMQQQAQQQQLPSVDVVIHRLDPRLNAIELGHFLLAIRPHFMVLGPVPETYGGVVESIGIPCRQLQVAHASDADADSEGEWMHVALPPSLHLAHMSKELAAYIATQPATTLPDGRSVRNTTALWDLDTNQLVPITTAADQAAAAANAPDPRFVCMHPSVDLRALGEQLRVKIKYPVVVMSDAEAVEVPDIGCRIVWDAEEGGVEVQFDEEAEFGEVQVSVMDAVGEVVAGMFPHRLGT
ncbi:beta-lactamase-like protein [Catenaria anguillulae PL171]|uniref:Beta-lactamase-like protein n=1 Tax=Catenaria anguillulae PL171 TaxID=765915 RepID=A0A1Y2HXI4_9FUNG|nr:beta-lactamase-like protein [Catenaria anguillulae PL171]